jgi:hypothetical protein
MNTQLGVEVSWFRNMKHPVARMLRVQPARIIQRERKRYLPIRILPKSKSIKKAGPVTAKILTPVRGEENCLTRKMYMERFCRWERICIDVTVSKH